jgi:hypothetical protein
MMAKVSRGFFVPVSFAAMLEGFLVAGNDALSS